MNQKGFANIILTIVIVALLGMVGYFAWIFHIDKKSEPIIQQPIITSTVNSITTTTPTTTTPTTTHQSSTDSDKYDPEPIAECVECVKGETLNNKPCCTNNFEKDCISKNGVVRWTDLHPVFTLLIGCFRKAPDAGKNCASANDCLSGVCDLESAIKFNRCGLIKKDFTGKHPFSGEKFYYTATYSCNTTKPGRCTEARENRDNPAGVSHTFKMNNKILIEILEPGPIS